MAYATNCFINCPFDPAYEKKLLKPIVFTAISVGLNPRICENPNNGQSRVEYLTSLIKDSKYGIHDICRMEISSSGYPRFNMPFELGIDWGLRISSIPKYVSKTIFIMDAKPHRYTAALSDLAGFDPIIHKEKPEILIGKLRNAFYTSLNDKTMISGNKIWLNYQKCMSDIMVNGDIDYQGFNEMPVKEYVHWVKQWFKGKGSLVAISMRKEL